MSPKAKQRLFFAVKVVVTAGLVAWLVKKGALDMKSLGQFLEHPSLLAWNVLVFVLACSKGAPDVAPMLPVLRELRLPATVYVTSYNAQHQTFVVGALLAYLMATSARNEIEIGRVIAAILEGAHWSMARGPAGLPEALSLLREASALRELLPMVRATLALALFRAGSEAEAREVASGGQLPQAYSVAAGRRAGTLAASDSAVAVGTANRARLGVLPAQARSGAAEGEEEEGEDEEGKAEDDKEPAEPRAKGEEGKSAGKDGGEKSDKK